MWLRVLLLTLAAFGLGLSTYMTLLFRRVQRGEGVRCFDRSCPLVLKTSYARSLGFPNYYLAIPYYLVLVTHAALQIAGVAAWLFWPVVVASVPALAMSTWLTLVLLVKLKEP